MKPTAPPPKPAGLPRRLGAILYDTLLLIAVLFIATALVLPFTDGEAVPAGNPLFSIYLLCACLLFFGWFWVHGGQTLGMRAWKIRLQQPDGAGITWPRAILRLLLGSLWVVPLLFSYRVLNLNLGDSFSIGLACLMLILITRVHDRGSKTLIAPAKR
jgi:uncharacterized RDD family membrane protein YckC